MTYGLKGKLMASCRAMRNSSMLMPPLPSEITNALTRSLTSGWTSCASCTNDPRNLRILPKSRACSTWAATAAAVATAAWAVCALDWGCGGGVVVAPLITGEALAFRFGRGGGAKLEWCWCSCGDIGDRGAIALADSGESGVRHDRELDDEPVGFEAELELLPFEFVVVESLLLLEEFDVAGRKRERNEM